MEPPPQLKGLKASAAEHAAPDTTVHLQTTDRRGGRRVRIPEERHRECPSGYRSAPTDSNSKQRHKRIQLGFPFFLQKKKNVKESPGTDQGGSKNEHELQEHQTRADTHACQR